MSRAFVKEDVDLPEPSGRKRSASGLPPGALNYITPPGAARLRAELAKLDRASGADADRISELREILEAVIVVEVSGEPGKSVGFGARVTVRNAQKNERIYHVVGVEELTFYPDAVSWISPIGKALLVAALGERLTLEEGGPVRVVRIEYPAE